MYRRQVYKKGMTIQTLERDCNQQLAEEGKEPDGKTDAKAFEKYFSNSDLFDLFQYKDESEGCDTLQLILEKDDFQYEKTPTNESHIQKFLYGIEDIVHGITLNSNLYTAEAGDGNSQKSKQGDLESLDNEYLGRCIMDDDDDENQSKS